MTPGKEAGMTLGTGVESSWAVVAWCRPLISALRRQRQKDLFEFKASLVYKS